MGQAEPIKTHYTFEEYLELENFSEIRHEYYHGEVFAMAGTTKRHSRVVRNILQSMLNLMNDEKCELFFDVKTEIIQKSYYVYPDLVVTCSENDDDPITIRTPSVIFEVLSDSTEEYDRGGKFKAYMQIPTLTHYVLVSQKSCKIECFTRRANEWIFNIYTTFDEFLELSCLYLKISLADIYKNITFDTVMKVQN